MKQCKRLRVVAVITTCLCCITASPAQNVRVGASVLGGGSLFSMPMGRELRSMVGQLVVGSSSAIVLRSKAGFLPVIGELGLPSTTTTIGVGVGWNLVSVPRTVNDYSKNTLFPTSTSQAFAYQAGYVSQPVLANGKGYWLKFGSSQSVLITGFPRALDSIAVLTGWNLIGSISTSLPVADVGSSPGGIVTSQFFGYAGTGYAVASTIVPGKGYWVKVSQNGRLFLSSSSPADALIRIVATSELPPPPPANEATATVEIPTEFSLGQNYPNPFNPTTDIRFQISDCGMVRLTVFDVLGQEVATLVNDTREPGMYTVSFDASNLSSGTYVYRLTTGGYTAAKKMMLAK